MNHVEMKVFPRKEKSLKFVFKSGKGEKWFENCFQMVEGENYIYLVKIFWKINNLENYLESGDVVHIHW